MLHISTILCPIDFSEQSTRVLLYALAFAVAHEARLDLLHVVQPVIYPPYIENLLQAPVLYVGTWLSTAHAMEGTLRRLNELAEQKRQLHQPITVQVALGVPFVQIVRAATERGADLIVMGTHARTGLKRLLFGSIAEVVVRRAPCPVFVVKGPERKCAPA